VDSPIGASLRGSYTTQPDHETLNEQAISVSEGSDGLAFGGGLFYRISDRYLVQFDYAWRHYGALGSVDAFTVTLGWNR